MEQHTLTRRGFLQFGAAALGSSALPHVQAAPEPESEARRDPLPSGRLLICGFTNKRLRHGRSDYVLPGTVVEISLPSLSVRAVGSHSTNLHDLGAAGPNGAGQLVAIGQDVPEIVEFFAPDLSEKRVLRFPDVRFKGHVLPHANGVLLAAESVERPRDPGFLLLLDGAGQELGRFVTGALGPHEPIVCGADIVVSHYGTAPRQGPFLEGELYEAIAPGISVLDGQTLALKAFHQLPRLGAVSHVASLNDRTVIAMQMNAIRAGAGAALSDMTLSMADRDGAVLLPSELGPFGGYQVPLPLHVVDLESGLSRTIERPASEMRRGQSFCRDSATGAVLGTFPHSQTVGMFSSDEEPIFRSSLDVGVADPRGCASLGDTGLIAISGNADNVAIVNARSGALVALIPTPLEQHSHMRWVAAA